MALQHVQAPQVDLRASTGKLLHRPKDVQDILGIGHTTLYRLIGQGKLKVVKIGAASRVTDDSVRAYVASLMMEAA
ncbi:excisionase family DNA binding protein [Methylobacterium sp. PvP062]|uniref:Excisionase family DNA binding protein n=1 Tax=Methylobacterium radiotolerans TaxID=31998 RepID=A0ABV2NG90_9HYPH|nr:MULTISPECIES: helix-turn-helix domain-containing protein [unclassified Methylobacterium]MBP2497807.1 excisionase family DNA binding protein [Methylobacterium sp. PvP105]MBP2502322.1 excisionase family DNA binding protein [Methylobacterium sp. PvP109]MBY0250719.1 helix-turn-helix domain-containing protein [Methylobacterium organophilum]MCX7335116.1 helix-turn-helix domain-containing protein [Hyphomicrobiales bacterium]